MTPNVAQILVRARALARPLVPTLRRIPGVPRVAAALTKDVAGPASVRTTHGFTVWVDASDIVVGRTLINDGEFEPGIARFVASHLRKGEVAVDVGANVGYYTGAMAEVVGPTGRVVAIEPAPATFALLRRTIDANCWPQVVPIQAAAGASSGQLSLQLDPLNWGNHSFAGKRGGSEVLVPVDTLNALLSEPLPSPVRLVKMDVQGWEGHVLAGAAEVLADKPIVVLEFHPEMLRHAGTDPQELLDGLFTAAAGIHLLDGATGNTARLYSPNAVLAACDRARWAQVDLVADLPGRLS